ncbi:unnamed protein product [Rotaria socialis]|uniref:C2H2-type domain-containing protein n=1 Tax=Rotaria socialis TaxID=392032 RepID=A0A818IX13_9BILA|nr:unnamed protein product [Rotaria socialis]CAF3310849.1 unnamed protein product [Rotaria socialis]CAF3454115.1 unnamed protein product [Rotaria socialis]CAF3526556.1 unnamed protein product [Rotaria socialis]CAF4197340.1 unnamed protein product [Rotaria socialis]
MNQYSKHSILNSSFECIIPTTDELNYETSQVKCPHGEKNSTLEKCQKVFKNIMALNVHLQMYHKETGIVTASNKYTSRIGRYHCPIGDCIFYCRCKKDHSQSLSFSNFNAVRLHYLRQHGLKKEQCSKCLKSFGLHQDLIGHEKICGVHCPFSCSNCDQQFQNRTSLRRHQLKYHTDANSESQNNNYYNSVINALPSLPKSSERRKRLNRRRPLLPDQIELSRQNILSHQPVTINPLALELLKSFNNEKLPVSSSSTIDSTLICESDSDKATQTYTRVSVGTECCSLTSTDLNLIPPVPIKTTEQKSSQTQSRIRVYKKQSRNSTKKSIMTSTITPTIATDDVSPITFYKMPTDTFNASTMTQWENAPVNEIETHFFTPTRSDMSIQTVGNVSNLLDYPSESSDNNNSVIVQTLPISMTSTQMQTITEYPLEQATNQYENYVLPYQESVGTSCFLDEFLLDDFSKNDSSSSVLFDFDAMDLLDLIDNGTQTYPLIASHEAQTMTNWDPMLLNEDEWIRTMMNN